MALGKLWPFLPALVLVQLAELALVLAEDAELAVPDALTEGQIRGLFIAVDTDKDGKVNMGEFMAFADKTRKEIAKKDIAVVLEEMDTDKDGFLSLAELMSDFEQWNTGDDEEDKELAEKRKEVEQKKFHAADTNRDGKLSSDELPAMFYAETSDVVADITARASMEQKDHDKDGKLNIKEFWEGDMKDLMEQNLDATDEEKADFKKLDLDGDGFINLEELKRWETGRHHTQEALQQLFEVADMDHDMHATLDELLKALNEIASSDAQYHLAEWAEHMEL